MARRDFIDFRLRRLEGGFRVVPRREGPAIAPAGRQPEEWRAQPQRLDLRGRARLLEALEALPLDDPEHLVAFCNRYGRFGVPGVDVPVRVGSDQQHRAEPVAAIVLALVEWQGARALRAALDAGAGLDAFVSRVSDKELWTLRLPLPEAAREIVSESTMGPHAVVRREGDAIIGAGVQPEDGAPRCATPEDAAQRWLNKLVSEHLGGWARWERREGVYSLRIDTALGIAWHAFATGPATRLCRRCGQPFTPSLRYKQGRADYCGPTCARYGQRQGWEAGERPRRRKPRDTGTGPTSTAKAPKRRRGA